MSLPAMHGTGRLTAAPELRFAKSGTAVATIPLAFNARKYNQDTRQWEDGDVFFVRGTVFGEPAENASETYRRGDEVVVSGRLKTDRWEDRQSGEKRSAAALLIDSIGPSTRYAKATITKTERRESANESEGWTETSPSSVNEPPF